MFNPTAAVPRLSSGVLSSRIPIPDLGTRTSITGPEASAQERHTKSLDHLSALRSAREPGSQAVGLRAQVR